jgi:hypothetical protein
MNLPDEMHAELTQAASKSQCTPARFAVEVLEAALASRRLDRLPPRMEADARGAVNPREEDDGER